MTVSGASATLKTVGMLENNGRLTEEYVPIMEYANAAKKTPVVFPPVNVIIIMEENCVIARYLTAVVNRMVTVVFAPVMASANAESVFAQIPMNGPEFIAMFETVNTDNALTALTLLPVSSVSSTVTIQPHVKSAILTLMITLLMFK